MFSYLNIQASWLGSLHFTWIKNLETTCHMDATFGKPLILEQSVKLSIRPYIRLLQEKRELLVE